MYIKDAKQSTYMFSHSLSLSFITFQIYKITLCYTTSVVAAIDYHATLIYIGSLQISINLFNKTTNTKIG